jgi:alanine racemase
MTWSETPPGVGAVLDVDLTAIVANWRMLCARHRAGPVAGVVKADAYGLGARQVAPALDAAGCRHFFVALLDEALAIRPLLPVERADRSSGSLLGVLNGLLPGSEADFVAHDITPVLGSLAEVAAWAAMARRLGRRLAGILHIDTGMARLGLDRRELAILQQDPARLDGVDVRYIMTHLVSSELADDVLNEQQRARFDAACAALLPARRSLANSSGIFLGDCFGSDLARPGAALYGINPTPGTHNPMRQTIKLSARVLQVRDVEAEESVGYNATWRAARQSRIATVALGYADGWHRSLSGRGFAHFDGRPVPLVGRVSMDLTNFDVTDHPSIVPGAWLDVIGPAVTPDDVAKAGGTNGYEVLTSLGGRFHRTYRTAVHGAG